MVIIFLSILSNLCWAYVFFRVLRSTSNDILESFQADNIALFITLMNMNSLEAKRQQSKGESSHPGARTSAGMCVLVAAD